MVSIRRKKVHCITNPVVINSEAVEIVDFIRFLGSFISNSLSWDHNVNSIVKKAQQQLFFLQQVKKFGLRREVLIQFYHSVVESVVTSALWVWYGGSTQHQKKCLERVVHTARKVISCQLSSLVSVYNVWLSDCSRLVLPSQWPVQYPSIRQKIQNHQMQDQSLKE